MRFCARVLIPADEAGAAEAANNAKTANLASSASPA